MTVNRRRSREIRATAAVGLLVVAGLLLAPALAIGARLILATTAVVVWLAGVGAARLLSNENVVVRREAGYYLATQARQYAATFAARVAEQDEFAATMSSRVAARDADIARLHCELESVRVQAAQAADQARNEAARARALHEAVTRLEARAAELSNDLDEQKTLASQSQAFWYGRHDPSVGPSVDPHIEDLVDWEERAAAPPAALRKQA